MGDNIQARATGNVKMKDSTRQPAVFSCLNTSGGLSLTLRDALQEQLVSALLAAAPRGVTKQSLMAALYGPKRPGRPSMCMLSVHCRIINAELERLGVDVRLDYWRRTDIALVPIGV